MRFLVCPLLILLGNAIGNPFEIQHNGEIVLTSSSEEYHRIVQVVGTAESGFTGGGDEVTIDESGCDGPTTTPRIVEKCQWAGQAPFCDGECPSGWTERSSNDHGDGKTCVTGKKKECCRKFNVNDCYWSGTAPFCAGSCDKWQEYTACVSDRGDGRECIGNYYKYKCCKPA